MEMVWKVEKMWCEMRMKVWFGLKTMWGTDGVEPEKILRQSSFVKRVHTWGIAALLTHDVWNEYEFSIGSAAFCIEMWDGCRSIGPGTNADDGGKSKRIFL